MTAPSQAYPEVRGRCPKPFREGTRGMPAATLAEALWGFRDGG
jgi:hypothetical protein